MINNNENEIKDKKKEVKCRKMELTDFLIKPMQRLCKYPLLLKVFFLYYSFLLIIINYYYYYYHYCYYYLFLLLLLSSLLLF